MLQYANEGPQNECNGQVDRAGTECEGSDKSTCETVHQDNDPSVILVLTCYDRLEPLHGFLYTYHVVNDLFVNSMSVPKFS